MILFALSDNCNYSNSDVHFKNVDVRIRGMMTEEFRYRVRTGLFIWSIFL